MPNNDVFIFCEITDKDLDAKTLQLLCVGKKLAKYYTCAAYRFKKEWELFGVPATSLIE
ncbi:MAG: hypothetical protein PVJ69_08915 [Desulfobacteraceae bacterium]|jgi:hypothetical protein